MENIYSKEISSVISMSFVSDKYFYGATCRPSTIFFAKITHSSFVNNEKCNASPFLSLLQLFFALISLRKVSCTN